MLQVKDDPRIILDEILGYLFSVSFLTVGSLQGNWTVLLAGFVLFRVFDVLKVPWPGAQKIRGGMGVVLDDVLAGITANLVIRFAVLPFIK